MTRLSWLARREGAIVLIALAVGLLIYGYAYERLFDLRGATVPAISLMLVLAFALWDLVFGDHGEVAREGRVTLAEIVLATALSYLFLQGLVHVGMIVTTSVALAIGMSLLARRIFVYGIAIAIGMAVFIWFLFVRLGGTYLPTPLLF